MNRITNGSAVPTEIAAANELVQAVDTAQKAASPGDLPMAGFGAGVHQYLNQLLTLIYSKTTTLIAANMVLTSLLLSTATRTSIAVSLQAFYVGSVCCFALSAITSVIVLFPRLHHHDANGLIFWRAILLKSCPEDYCASVRTLDKASVEEEYAKDNYHMARTIRFKDALLRCAIAIFVVGIVCALIGVVGPMVVANIKL